LSDERDAMTAHAACPIRIVDLFAGVGGLALGWIDAAGRRGAQVLAAVDIDDTLKEAYAWNFPGVRFLQHRYGDPNNGDEARVVADTLGLSPGDVDVLVAGPPCQTFSKAGKRVLDIDSRLVFHVCDFAEALRPPMVVIENVPEFGRVQDGRLIGRVRVLLTNAGYAVTAMRLCAVDFGVPQARERCFVIAVRRDLDMERKDVALRLLRTPRMIQWLAYAGETALAVASHTTPSTTVAEGIGDLPPLAVGEGVQETVLTTRATSAYQGFLRDKHSRLFNHVAVRHSSALVAAMARMQPGETPQRADSHPLSPKTYFTGAYGRLAPHRPAPTMTTFTQNAGSGRFTHYRDHRVLTVREVARLQGFPDWFRFFGSQETQRRHVGNAVPPLLAQAVASTLLPLIDG